MSYASSDVILICTTEPGLNEIITRILEPKWFRFISALNQHMLFSLIESYCPAVVIADSGLSRIMGFSPCEIIKGVERFRNTRVVLITGYDVQSSKDAHQYADDVIDRDLVSTKLLAAVCKYYTCDSDMQIKEDMKRLARAIVSDIVHYNHETAYMSAADGTFYDILSKEIEKGRALYRQRTSVILPPLPDYFNEAIVDFINKSQQCNLVLP
ncbi:MAG: hypothetical protein IT392_05955 [Nitrospirae bacterium]|nr:hypothetical protein [Nitrospirota bacterium]